MRVAQVAFLLLLVHGYKCEQLPHRYQQLRRNNRVPENSFPHSSSFDQGTYELYELHFSPLYNQPPVQLSTSVELISAHGHGLLVDVLLKSYSPFDVQDRETPLQDIAEADRRALFYDTSVSKLRGTCIPTLSDLNCLRCSLKPLSRDFERST